MPSINSSNLHKPIIFLENTNFGHFFEDTNDICNNVKFKSVEFFTSIPLKCITRLKFRKILEKFENGGE